MACSIEASRTVAEQAQLFKITVSFGSVSSLISLPCYMSHASIPADVRAARGLPDDLVRISVGIEDPEDLLQGKPSEAHVVPLEHQKHLGGLGNILLWDVRRTTACSVLQPAGTMAICFTVTSSLLTV